jgi:hypothetical protein
VKFPEKSFSTATGYNANHAWPVCKFMHIGEACLWSFFFAAAVEQEYDSGRKLFRLSEEQFPPV